MGGLSQNQRRENRGKRKQEKRKQKTFNSVQFIEDVVKEVNQGGRRADLLLMEYFSINNEWLEGWTTYHLNNLNQGSSKTFKFVSLNAELNKYCLNGNKMNLDHCGRVLAKIIYSLSN